MFEGTRYKIKRFFDQRSQIQNLEFKICRQRRELARLWQENAKMFNDYCFWYERYKQMSRQLEAIKKREDKAKP